MVCILSIAVEKWPIAGNFTIARGSKTVAEVIVVTMSDGVHSGRGECVPYARYGETVASVLEQINAFKDEITTREALADILPAGAARNAVDCALWDLSAKQQNCTVFDLLGKTPAASIPTAFTLSVDTSTAMEACAKTVAHMPLLKVKLAGKDDLECIAAVRRGAPNAALMVDANESWDEALYTSLIGPFKDLGVIAIEQPFPVDADDCLNYLPRPIPIVADESCHTQDDLSALVGKYDYVNIKLDKTGGLTHALVMEKTARAMGFKIMVGCMVSTSLSMAPAMVLAKDAEIVDLDGPLLLQKDRPEGVSIIDGIIKPASPKLWG